ncbi:tetratricopeptide repeat protein [uncultured Microscilla sp.]|uniref:tetratricopeptide repeat protein n=1 Tax=uncultured Microscilla sp. TaxID=432653 RepID=UPI00263861C8|nr:tetratricopeptide repeat protein [uncultured Microscilla sp.]
MKNSLKHPMVYEYDTNTWTFAFPSIIFESNVFDELWNAIDSLDYQDNLAEEKLRNIIKKYPYHIDAYNHLSLACQNQNKNEESFSYAQKAYSLGKECFPKNFSLTKNNLNWSVTDNRPFLRACKILGLEYQERGMYKQAQELYKEILLLNENDHQDVRYLYLECLFLSKEYNQAQTFIEKYYDETSVEFVYGKIIILILNNHHKRAQELLEQATKVNQYLPEIIKNNPSKRILSAFNNYSIRCGSVEEALYYLSRNKFLYEIKKIKKFYKSYNKTEVN